LWSEISLLRRLLSFVLLCIISQILKTEYAVRGEIVTRAQVLYPLALYFRRSFWAYFTRYIIFVAMVARALDAHL
jgi:hypothetical protein